MSAYIPQGVPQGGTPPLQTIEQIGQSMSVLSASIQQIGSDIKTVFERVDNLEKGTTSASASAGAAAGAGGPPVQSGGAAGAMDNARAALIASVEAVVAAAAESDPAKREAAVREAMYHSEKERKAAENGENKEDNDKMASLEAAVKNMGAIIQVQQAEIAKPRMDVLTASYEAVGAPPDMIKAKPGGMGVHVDSPAGCGGGDNAPVYLGNGVWAAARWCSIGERCAARQRHGG